jgi:hypothetical protein
MGLTYNKQLTTKDRRILTNGPADRQRKQQAINNTSVADLSLVEELKNQIFNLQEQLEKKSPTEGLYTSDQVNDEIIKAVKVETVNLSAKNEVLENKILDLKNNYEKEIHSLKEIIKNKEDIIQQLKDNKSSAGISESKLVELLGEATKRIEEMSMNNQGLSKIDVDPNRPKMETIFVDPIEKTAPEIEKHFEIEDVATDQKDQMLDKVNKLKNLMGKLPGKR